MDVMFVWSASSDSGRCGGFLMTRVEDDVFV